LNGIYQHYIIDLSTNNNFVQIPTVQGDGNNIRGFEVELIQNGLQYIIDKSDTIICIMGTKPDTKQIVNNCTITNDGYILVDITSQMSAIKGRGDYQIVLMSKRTNSQLKSFPFHILTTPATFDLDYIISTDEFQYFTHKIIETSIVIDNANKAISDVRTLENNVKKAESGRVDAENARINAEKNRVSAESTRVSNENTRISNENTRKTNETARQNAETNRANAESRRASAESIRVANENTRISNENTRKTNETARQTAETGRASAESTRVSNENTRKTNETTRQNNESSRVTAESGRVSAENTRKSNETTRQNNESTRQSSESARQTNTNNAISNANKATDRANKAAEACEGIVSGSGVVMKTEKGAANGVATLDGNRKLTSSQLPVASGSVLGGVKTGSNITNSNGTISISKSNVTGALGFTPIQMSDTSTEIISATEPVANRLRVGDFWLQEY
jgi:hypothetical protein